MRCFDATVSVVRRVSEDGTFTALTASPKLYFCACVGVKNGLVLQRHTVCAIASPDSYTKFRLERLTNCWPLKDDRAVRVGILTIKIL